MIFALFFFTFITMVGGNPLHDKYGFRSEFDISSFPSYVAYALESNRYWHDPGPFVSDSAKDRFLGVWDSVVWACFAVVGPDYISLIGGEVRHLFLKAPCRC
jgi:amino acid transporter